MKVYKLWNIVSSTEWWQNQERNQSETLVTFQFSGCLTWGDGRWFNRIWTFKLKSRSKLSEFILMKCFRRQRSVLCATNNSLGERSGRDVGMKSQHVVTDANRREKKRKMRPYEVITDEPSFQDVSIFYNCRNL